MSASTIGTTIVVKTLEQRSGPWQYAVTTLEGFRHRAKNGAFSGIAFIDHPDLFPPVSTRTQQRFCQLDIPPSFWSEERQKSNGYFSAEDELAPDDTLTRRTTSFRFLLKTPTSKPDSKRVIYEWHKCGFVSHWWPSGKSLVMGFNIPEAIQERIHDHLIRCINAAQRPSLFLTHATVTAELVKEYDRAVWLWRDFVRWYEVHRPGVDHPELDYSRIHDIARHVIHSTEVLSAALAVIDGMLEDLNRTSIVVFQLSPARSTAVWQEFKSLRLTLAGLHRRSEALEKRLNNEISLAYHINTQHDSAVTTRIAQATQRDSITMRTISVLGLFFLPPTFVAAIFSMSFFNYNPETQLWDLSNKFWMYWVVTIPLTMITVGLGLLWQWSENKAMQRRAHFPESQEP